MRKFFWVGNRDFHFGPISGYGRNGSRCRK